jgi:hypothetical protein
MTDDTDNHPTQPVEEVRGREIQTRLTRSNVPVSGKYALLLGLPFVAIGAAIVLVASDAIKIDPSKIHAPRWAIGSFGAVFGLAGLLFVIHGVRSAIHGSRTHSMAFRFPDEPWLADYAWNQRAIRSETVGVFLGLVFCVLFMALFLAPFNWWAFWSKEGGAFVIAIVGLFDFFFLVGIVLYVRMIIQHIKYGVSQLRFAKFPFFLGDTIDVEFSNARGIGFYDKLTFTLRCMQERYEMRGAGKNRGRRVIKYELYADEHVKEGPAEHRPGEVPMKLSFRLPDGDFSTQLSNRPARYWELDVVAKTPGVDFEATFLLPVYARPS